MGIFRRGRPHKVKFNDLDDIPSLTGEYRIRDADGTFYYIGITNVLRRRLKEHKSSGLLQPDQRIEYLVLKAGIRDYEPLREHERNSIKKHKPYANKRDGGAGAPPKYIYPEDFYDDVEPVTTGGRGDVILKLIGWTIRIVSKIIKIAIILAIVGAVVYFAWYYFI